ncbi:uncharacterized protein LOC102711026 isoform X2 [Oryza brachyantha]|uniref:uncharacterized protein LOC102711026 isoform X2 n=1 Tax=Oryza brachyantha TaxID=4533 RepID=UPI00077696F5|nr:uncharacterized protein LOC102711026 isoform X2 [Oryza brachyantha]
MRADSPPPPEKRRLALADVTNIFPGTPTSPTTTRPPPLPVSKPSFSSSTISAQSATGEGASSSLLNSPISTVYTRRRKRKTSSKWANRNKPFPAGTASCPPPSKRTNRKTSVDQDTRPISSSASCHKAKKGCTGCNDSLRLRSIAHIDPKPCRAVSWTQ